MHCLEYGAEGDALLTLYQLPATLRIRYLVQRGMGLAGCRLMLLFMGFWWISTQYYRLNKRLPYGCYGVVHGREYLKKECAG